MSASVHATPHNDPAPHAATARAPDAHADADASYYRQALHDLINMGTGFARLLHDTAQAQAAHPAAAPPAAPAPQATAPQPAPAPAAANTAALASLAAAFGHVARAVRRCVLLAQTLDKPLPPARTPAQHRAAARKQIIRAVEDAIQRPRYDDEDDDERTDSPEALCAELRERMDAPDLENDITSRPVAEVIEEICRDLGIAAVPGTRPFKRRTPADVALLCARAAAPGGARQPGPEPQGPTPHGPAQRPSAPAEGCAPRPAEPAAAPRAQPGSTLPDDPAEAVALILCHHAAANGRWRPPPSG